MQSRQAALQPSTPTPGFLGTLTAVRLDLLFFPLAFVLLWLLHSPWLRLPYFWDEAGYYIPAARDLWLTGDPIPVSTVSNAHPPLVMAWLAAWWKCFHFSPLVTRTAMLALSAFALTGLFRLARRIGRSDAAWGAALLTALYPVYFAQSSLAHLDMAASASTLWGLGSYVSGRRWQAAMWFGLAGIAKETALLAPMAIFGCELILLLWGRLKSGAWASEPTAGRSDRVVRSLAVGLFRVAVACLPLAVWLLYHHRRTGVVFGNPEYFRYNVGATVHPLRIVLALVVRLWQLFGYLNMFVLIGAALLAAIWSGARQKGDQSASIAVSARWVLGSVVLVYLAALSVVGGAVLARYLLPVYPLVILAGVSVLRQKLSWWKPAIALVALAFVVGIFVSPPYRISPEDNLTYVDFVRLHQGAAAELSAMPQGRVLTAWPATDELRWPFLGYVAKAIPVVAVEHFSREQLDLARGELRGHYDYAWVFSTKYEPGDRFRGRWESVQVRFFDYHRDVTAEGTAQALGGKVVYHARRGAEWVAIISLEK